MGRHLEEIRLGKTSTCIPFSMSKNKKGMKKLKCNKNLSTKVKKINGHGVGSCAGGSTGIDGVGSCAGSSTGISGVGLLKKSSAFGTPILLRHLVTARVGLQRA
ncbi:hypothetical protein TNCT_76351 [Trichonephila clavata]|uniref:Uncharacterized protein n=1 Tax=Trichonephila clavata TaxID=2740835 RepID=A0A8X6M5M9_TRICU|nr:hypothetical protein TNCT_76251 [Trichonephila clavata]GFR32827.1 hypothetical protein TNCT_76351 [Trichonephila clavata]